MSCFKESFKIERFALKKFLKIKLKKLTWRKLLLLLLKLNNNVKYLTIFN